MNRTYMIRLAAELPVGSAERQALLSILKKGKSEHKPGDVWKTDSGNWRGKNDKGEGKTFKDKDKAETYAKGKKDEGSKDDDKGSADVEVTTDQFVDKTPASDSDIEDYKSHPVISKLKDAYKLDIIAGPDGKLTRGDLMRAIHVAEKMDAGIDTATDFCNVNPPACEGNLGITRDNMPQIMDEPVKDMLRNDEEQTKAYDANKKKGKPAFADLPKEKQEKEKKEWAAKRKKGQAAVDAGADPDSDKSMQETWFDTLKEGGIKINDDTISVGELIASQAEIKAAKSYGIAQAYMDGSFSNLPDLPILVARDPETGKATVIDGHHRYAGLLTADPTRKMKVKVIETPIREALQMAAEMPGVFRADLQDNIVGADAPQDLAREPGSAWQQKGKWYGKNKEGKAGGPFKDKDGADAYAKGKKSEDKPKKEASVLAARAAALVVKNPALGEKVLPALRRYVDEL